MIKISWEDAGKWALFQSANAANQAALLGLDAASYAIRQSRYAAGLSRQIEILTLNDELKNNPDAEVNNLLLVYKKRGLLVEFDDVKIGVKKENQIKSTEIVHRDGTVKEYITAKDYAIKLSGTIRTDTSGKFPYREMQQLMNILSAADMIEVTNIYLNDIFLVYDMVFESGDFDQNAIKYMNVMPYSLTFKSDTEYDFLLS
jgi:hypothetical protein